MTRSDVLRVSCWLLLVVLGSGGTFAVNDVATVRFTDPEFPSRAAELPIGGVLRLEGVPLFPGEPGAVLELRRFRVFTPDAHIVVHGADGARQIAPPARAYFRGTVAGEPEALAFVALGGAGGLSGLVMVRGERFTVGPAEDPAAGWTVRRSDGAGSVLAHGADGVCPADELPDFAASAEDDVAPSTLGTTPDLQAARVAVETDWELFDRLGSETAVMDYVAELFGVASSVYRRDVQTELQVSFLSLWSTPDDPFEVTGGLFDALFELGDVWHALHPTLPRTLTHLLSGRSGLQGGVAYHGVLCQPDVQVSGHWAGGYSLSGNVGSLGMERDLFIMTHEIGHNFRSHHSHCYNDLPLDGDPPIDRCFSGDVRNDGHACYAGPTSVPFGGGSIMSYCHLLAGGHANVNLSLGAVGAYGVRSERVIQRIRAHIASVGCLVPVEETLFADGFETGDTSRWSSTS